mmetsp:Transcript_56818/g.169647  ORF Transcript_56818/g.169647 Transcript_56818/m.169647 type:complete len:210 (+) Transcript_56818:901-1530(+)
MASLSCARASFATSFRSILKLPFEQSCDFPTRSRNMGTDDGSALCSAQSNAQNSPMTPPSYESSSPATEMGPPEMSMAIRCTLAESIRSTFASSVNVSPRIAFLRRLSGISFFPSTRSFLRSNAVSDERMFRDCWPRDTVEISGRKTRGREIFRTAKGLITLHNTTIHINTTTHVSQNSTPTSILFRRSDLIWLSWTHLPADHNRSPQR